MGDCTVLVMRCNWQAKKSAVITAPVWLAGDRSGSMPGWINAGRVFFGLGTGFAATFRKTVA